MPHTIYPDRQTWIAARKDSVGASEVAALLGASPYRGPIQVYTSKVSGSSEPETSKMRAGLLFEAPIAELWSAENDYTLIYPFNFATGRSATPGAFVVWHDPNSHLSCTPDFFAADDGGRYVVECKNVTPELSRVDTDKGGWKQGPPLHYVVQVQIQLGVLSRCGVSIDGGKLIAFFGGDDVREYSVEFDSDLFDTCCKRVEGFWNNNVLARVVPDPDRYTTSELMTRAFRNHVSGKTVEVPASIVVALREAREAADSADSFKDSAEVAFKAAMGDAEIATCGGVVVATWKQHTSHHKAKAECDVVSRPLLIKDRNMATVTL